MSENYQSDVRVNENSDGTVSFATEVIATIAGLAATEVEGVANMSTNNSGIADMFARKNSKNLTKGVRIDLTENKVSADISIVVEYGSPVPEVAQGIQENVKKAIETMSGLDVSSVDVHVTGISFEKDQKAAAELEEQHKRMLEMSEKAAAEAEKNEESKIADEKVTQNSEDVGETEETAEADAEITAEN